MNTREDFDSDPMAAFLVRYSPVGPMPVDAAIAMSTANQSRPGILSPRADKDEKEQTT
jgi:hypothetical protein